MENGDTLQMDSLSVTGSNFMSSQVNEFGRDSNTKIDETKKLNLDEEINRHVNCRFEKRNKRKTKICFIKIDSVQKLTFY